MVLEAGHGFTVVFPFYVQVPTAGKYWVTKGLDVGILGMFHVFVNGETISSVYEGDPFTVGPRSEERWVNGHYRPSPENSSFSTRSINGNGLSPYQDYTEISLAAGVNRLVVVYTNTSQSAYLASCQFNIMPAGGDGSPLQYYSPKDLNGIEGKLVYQCIPALSSVSGLDEGSVKGAVYYVADMDYNEVRGSGIDCYPVHSCTYDALGSGVPTGSMLPYPFPLKTSAGVSVSKNPWPRAYVSLSSVNIFFTCFNKNYFKGGAFYAPEYPNTWWNDFVTVALPAWQHEVRASWFGFARGEIFQGGRWPVDDACIRFTLGGLTYYASNSLPAGTFPWALTARTTTPGSGGGGGGGTTPGSGGGNSAGQLRVERVDGPGTFTTIAGFASERKRFRIVSGSTPLTKDVTVQFANLDGVTAASFFDIAGLAVDSNENLYCASIANWGVLDDAITASVIFKISPISGDVAVFAGSLTERRAQAPVDGHGASARFGTIADITIDNNNNLYVADEQWIRKITPAGAVTTFSDSVFMPRKLATDNNNNLYVVNGDHEIRKITPSGQASIFAGNLNQAGYVDGVGADARFELIFDITVDNNNNIYVADMRKIRKITPTALVTTLAGNEKREDIDGTGTAASFFNAHPLCYNLSDNSIYVENGSKFRKVTLNGVVTTISIDE